MARTKKTIKFKEPVKIRFKKLANGNQSIYLDIYKDGVRSYKFIKNMFIVPEVDEDAKVRNQNTMLNINAIKSQIILDIANETANVSKASNKSKMLLVDWMNKYKELKQVKSQSDSFAKIIDKTIKYIVKYKGGKTTLKQVDKDYCKGFLVFLQSVKQKNGNRLAQATQRNYYKIFNCALNRAVKDEIISVNPFSKIEDEDKIQAPESSREYLSIDEVKALMETPCKNIQVKLAFLFSCFTALRCSDIIDLTWGDIKRDGEKYKITKQIVKTRRTHTIALSEQAVKCLPLMDGAKPTDKVFDMPVSNYHNVVLKEWAKDAGIEKNISFHVARHTCATLGITANIDLYVLSKLLGHTQIKTTQIYAKVMDKKKDDAVNAISNLF